MARPEFKPTAKQRREVSIAAGGGMAHDAIAAAIGISKPTLEKHFKAELFEVASRRRFESLVSLHKAALKGNVSAIKAYLATQEPRGIAPPAAELPPTPAGEKGEGKKAKANRDAKTAGDGNAWGNLLKFPGGKAAG